MLCKIVFISFDYLQKNFEKDLQKGFAKTKHVVQAWSKILRIKETIHAYLVSIYIGSIPSNLCTYIMQTSSIMHFHICFGLCWHQSPKKGEIEREIGLHLFLLILVVELPNTNNWTN